MSNMPFQAYVTIVKQTIKKNGGCLYNNESKVWMHTGNATNNEKCIHQLVVFNNTEVHVNFELYTIGDTAGDYIGYYDETNTLVKINEHRDEGLFIPNKSPSFTPYKNGTSKNITWEYFEPCESDFTIMDLQFAHDVLTISNDILQVFSNDILLFETQYSNI
uniref:Uncharacterized protein n=1 Tax=Panagrolaimus sp. ES5 TaxID=591445 RepID=A0AC34F789_9BILA